MSQVNFLYLSIADYGGPAKDLADVNSITVNFEEDGAGGVPTINRERRMRHHQIGTRGYTVELECKISATREVDWTALWNNATIFRLTYEEAVIGQDGTRSYELSDCRVEGVSLSNSSDGETTETVTIRPLNRTQIG